MKWSIYFSIIFFVLSGCNKDYPIDSGQQFQITVRNQTGTPVEGATVEGGVDWTYYRVLTNAAGVATLPGSAHGQRATIWKTNSLPIIVSSIAPISYTLNETSKELKLIGSVAGKAIRFKQSELITLDYKGIYHLYSYNDQSVSEIYNRLLQDSALATQEIQLLGDILWFTTYNSGVYVFSIHNPSSPLFLFRLPVSGYLGPFAVKDSILILGDPWEPGPLRIMVYYPTGDCQELTRVKNYFVRKMTIIGNTIILLGNSESLPTVFDISNPAWPRLLYNGLEWEYQTGFFYNNLIILTPRYGSGGNNVRLDYKVLDLSNPGNPLPMRSFTADSWITGITSDNSAFGNYYCHTQTISVLNGSISSEFQTIATVSENTIDGVSGAFPPYYLIGNQLWKLVDR